MQTIEYFSAIIRELCQAESFLSEQKAEEFVNSLLESRKVFTAGAGRSGFMGKSFAMRLMHMGLDAYTVGETVTPAFEKEDMLIIGSGSGETKSLLAMAEKAKSIGGKVAVVTISPDSSLGRLADITVQLPGAPKDKSDQDKRSIQPMGSLFEQTLLLFYDAVILRFMEKRGLNSSKMYGNHANLE